MIPHELRVLLGRVWKRPLMFFHDEDSLLSSVHGLINGYCYARDEASAFCSIVNGREGAFPGSTFTRYLQSEHSFPPGMGADWVSLIRDRHGSDYQALDAFFDYLNQFLSENGAVTIERGEQDAAGQPATSP